MIKANTYFDDHVRSLGFADAVGKATVGVMLPGRYTFNTDGPETMTVVSGELVVQLPDAAGAADWRHYPAGTSFQVPGKTAFHLRVAVASSYLCRFH